MDIYYGDLKDSQNRESHSFLQINSCGSTVTENKEYTVIRSGRNDYHILYVTDGEVEVYENGSPSRLGRGDLILYPPKAPQKYKRLPSSKDCWVHFNGFQVPEILSDARLGIGISTASESTEAKALFTELITEHSLRKDKAVTSEKGLLLTLLYTLGRLASKSPSPQNETVRRAVAYINENPSGGFSNAELANICNLSLGRFEHIFKEETGISPKAYRQRLRIENAKFLLTSTRLTVLEISELNGFSDQLYFSRIFKKKTGVSPLEYRRARMK